MSDEFETFVHQVDPSLRRALAGHMPIDRVGDAVAEALAYAWEHWDRVRAMDNPSGYLFRVAQSRSRSRMDGSLPPPDPDRAPDVEPRLVEAMRSLPTQQRTSIWLVHACGWTYAEAAAAMDISASAVGTHLARGTAALRERLGVNTHE
ncbi:unnamed protein product [Phaeothamnion confervicola]